MSTTFLPHPPSVSSAVRSSVLLAGPCFLDLDHAWHDHFVRVAERFKQDQVERRGDHEKSTAGDEVMSAHSFPAGGEGDQSENGKQDDDGVEAGALPVAAAKV